MSGKARDVPHIEIYGTSRNAAGREKDKRGDAGIRESVLGRTAEAKSAGNGFSEHIALPALARRRRWGGSVRTSLPLRIAILLAAALAAPLLSACSFGPVYSTAAQTQSALALRYAAPASRLEQIFYQDLARALGRASDPTAPILSVSIGIDETRVGLSSAASPISDRQIVATATWTVRENGTIISTGKRTAVSGYQRTGQTFADDRAEANAETEAVRATAEAVRLALLAQLAEQ